MKNGFKIVHFVGKDPQIVCAGGPYRSIPGEESWHGWRVDELLIVTKDELTDEESPLYLEGSAADIRQVLVNAIEVLDSYESVLKERFQP